VPDDPAGPLSEASIAAAVRALAERNRHHLESMTAAERADAAQHWRELALAVLTAATAATGLPEAADAAAAGPDAGRAVFVLEDVGGDGVAVHASFSTQSCRISATTRSAARPRRSRPSRCSTGSADSSRTAPDPVAGRAA